MDLSELKFRAENCRRVAAALINPDVIRELNALARAYESQAARLKEEDRRD